jgi:hypothetical protein
MGFEPNGMRSTDESINEFCDWIAAQNDETIGMMAETCMA